MKSVLVVALASAAVFAQTPHKSNAKPTPEQKQAKEEATPQKDPVCGMTIDPKTADAKYAYKGKTYYFCSKEDMDAFTKNPDKYAKK